MSEFADKALEALHKITAASNEADRAKSIMNAKLEMLKAVLVGKINDAEVEKARQEVLDATSAYIDAYIKGCKNIQSFMNLG